MLGKTIYIQFGQALTSAFRSAPFWGAPAENAAPTDSYECNAVHKSVPTMSNQSFDNNSSSSIASIWALTPFTDSAITGDIAKNIQRVLPCRWSFTFDITELEEESKSNGYPWESSDCLLIMGNIQSVSPQLFKGVLTYLNNGGRVIYWGNIAPDDESQFKLIGARRRSDLSKVCISSLSTSSVYTQDIRKFYPIEKIPRFTSLAPDCQVLLQGESGSSNTPVAWTRKVNSGKLFYCSLAEESDWLCDDCHALMLNAVRWAFEKN